MLGTWPGIVPIAKEARTGATTTAGEDQASADLELLAWDKEMLSTESTR